MNAMCGIEIALECAGPSALGIHSTYQPMSAMGWYVPGRWPYESCVQTVAAARQVREFVIDRSIGCLRNYETAPEWRKPAPRADNTSSGNNRDSRFVSFFYVGITLAEPPTSDH